MWRSQYGSGTESWSLDLCAKSPGIPTLAKILTNSSATCQHWHCFQKLTSYHNHRELTLSNSLISCVAVDWQCPLPFWEMAGSGPLEHRSSWNYWWQNFWHVSHLSLPHLCAEWANRISSWCRQLCRGDQSWDLQCSFLHFSGRTIWSTGVSPSPLGCQCWYRIPLAVPISCSIGVSSVSCKRLSLSREMLRVFLFFAGRSFAANLYDQRSSGTHHLFEGS